MNDLFGPIKRVKYKLGSVTIIQAKLSFCMKDPVYNVRFCFAINVLQSVLRSALQIPELRLGLNSYFYFV